MDAYNKCSEKIGETVEATAKKTNGTYEIINIKYVQAKPAAYAPVFIFLSYK
jgi:hypothetical protein